MFKKENTAIIIMIIMNLVMLISSFILTGVELTKTRNELDYYKQELDSKNQLLKEIGFDAELKCPKCDSGVTVSISNNFFYIECDECDILCGYYPYESKDKLFDRWNSGNIEDEEE